MHLGEAGHHENLGMSISISAIRLLFLKLPMIIAKTVFSFPEILGNLMIIRRLFVVLSVSLVLVGCFPVKVASNRDSGYKDRLTDVLIWESSGSLEGEYPVLKDRMSRLTAALAKDLENLGVKTSTLTTTSLDLNLSERIRSEVQRTGAKQVLRVQLSMAKVTTGVDFYDVNIVVIETGARREVWKATLGANFYSRPDEMAKKLIAQLQQDGML